MGPLSGIRIIEITGLGPGPFCGMMLADIGTKALDAKQFVKLRDEVCGYGGMRGEEKN